MQDKVNQNIWNIDLTKFAAGCYFIRIGNYYEKLIKY